MKIYHTETQEAYDALMVELEAQGCEWLSGDRMTELSKNWKRHSSKTCVSVDKKVVMFDKKSYYTSKYPEVPITKYKAKVDEKMKFTKENVMLLLKTHGGVSLDEAIKNLDDTPEKVVVPKFVAEFYEGCENATIYYLIDQLARYEGNSKLGKWYKNCEGRHENGKANAQEVIAKMELYGYEVEKEPLYCVNINGQYLVKMIPERNVHKFVEEVNLRIWDPQAYQLTEAEIKAIDERYIPFMVPADD